MRAVSATGVRGLNEVRGDLFYTRKKDVRTGRQYRRPLISISHTSTSSLIETAVVLPPCHRTLHPGLSPNRNVLAPNQR